MNEFKLLLFLLLVDLAEQTLLEQLHFCFHPLHFFLKLSLRFTDLSYSFRLLCSIVICSMAREELLVPVCPCNDSRVALVYRLDAALR